MEYSLSTNHDTVSMFELVHVLYVCFFFMRSSHPASVCVLERGGFIGAERLALVRGSGERLLTDCLRTSQAGPQARHTLISKEVLT